MKWNEGFFAEIGKGPEARALVEGIANDVADVVRRTGPVDSAEYVSTVRVDVVETPYRVVARVVADCDHAMLVEARFGTLARALGTVGSSV